MRVGLFVTCLVDAMRPSIGFATIKLLEDAGCAVVVPEQQTCCGQPAFNTGDDDSAKRLAIQVVKAFDGVDYLVAPSGSCAGMIKSNVPQLLADDDKWRDAANSLADRTFEITAFLDQVLAYQPKPPAMEATATYHDSCSGLRELGIHDQPRTLLSHVPGLTLLPLEGHDICCGFGGTFCVKFPEISNAIVTAKVEAIEKTGADLLLAGDLGCLMNMAGKLSRLGSRVRCYHAVEILAGVEDNGIVETT